MTKQNKAPLQQHHRHGGEGQRQQRVGGGSPGQHHFEGQHRDLAQQKHQHPGTGGHGPDEKLHEPDKQHKGRSGDHDAPKGFPAQKSASHHPGPGKERVDACEFRRRHARKSKGRAALPHPHSAKEQAAQECGQLHQMLCCVGSLFLSIHGPIVDDGRGLFSANPATLCPVLPDRIGGPSGSSVPFPAFPFPRVVKTLSCPGRPNVVYCFQIRSDRKGQV